MGKIMVLANGLDAAAVRDGARMAGWSVVDGTIETAISSSPLAAPSIVVAESPRLRIGIALPSTRPFAIIALGEDPHREFDDVLTSPTDLRALESMLARWAPVPLTDSTNRIVATFGETAIAPMLARFADLLSEGLADFDGRTAHRIAGVAGTLGFAPLGAMWLALSEGLAVDRDALKRQSRLAIGTALRASIDTAG